jgi:hypothetical protein
VEAQPRALEPGRLTLEAWRLTFEAWRLTLEHWRLALEPWRLALEPWRLLLELLRVPSLGTLHLEGKISYGLNYILWGYIFSPCGETKNEAQKEKYWIQGQKKQKESVLVLKKQSKQLYYFLVP